MTAVLSAEGLVENLQDPVLEAGGDERSTALDLQVAAGEIFGLLGPNGAGKTTTVKILLDLTRPTTGDARSSAFHEPAREPQTRRLPSGGARFPGYLTARQTLSIFGRMSGVDGRRRGRMTRFSSVSGSPSGSTSR